MNKFQKVAVQIAKDDLKKECWNYKKYGFNKIKNSYYEEIKNNKYTIKQALRFKNWNKKLLF